MVRRRFSAVSNHVARLVPFILRDGAAAPPQDEVRQKCERENFDAEDEGLFICMTTANVIGKKRNFAVNDTFAWLPMIGGDQC
jgi:hypothetical protein